MLRLPGDDPAGQGREVRFNCRENRSLAPRPSCHTRRTAAIGSPV